MLPESFALDTSRGSSSEELELFMRISVLATEAIAWLPVVLLWCWSELASRSRRSKVDYKPAWGAAMSLTRRLHRPLLR